jgi:Fe-S cluster assembly scaffold IscU
MMRLDPLPKPPLSGLFRIFSNKVNQSGGTVFKNSKFAPQKSFLSTVHHHPFAMAYSEKVLDHFKNPRNVGTLDKDKKNVGTGLVGAPECGDVMRLQIEVDENSGTILDAKFKTFGCGSAIASSSLATEWLKGKTLDQAMSIDNMDIVEELSLPPVKIHCSVLAEDAIKAAIQDYRTKNEAQA